MEESGLYFVVFSALFVETAVAQCSQWRGTPVDQLCATILCAPNQPCRAVQRFSGAQYLPQASCLKCTPIGVDDVCNKNHYFYAVLVGDANDVRYLSELKCDINKPGCPEGSTCLPDDSRSGTCCYGKGHPPSGVDIVRNNDTPCPDKCGGCDPGFTCQLRTFPCLIPPCPVGYQCIKIKRSCRVLPAYVPDDCPHYPRGDQCKSEGDCPAGLICCSDICSTRLCMVGFSR